MTTSGATRGTPDVDLPRGQPNRRRSDPARPSRRRRRRRSRDEGWSWLPQTRSRYGWSCRRRLWPQRADRRESLYGGPARSTRSSPLQSAALSAVRSCSCMACHHASTATVGCCRESVVHGFPLLTECYWRVVSWRRPEPRGQRGRQRRPITVDCSRVAMTDVNA
jgi:hypothetical protein